MIVFDRFHVKQLLNKAMDEVRKQQRRKHSLLKGHKYTFLKSNKQLTSQQQTQRQNLIEWYPLLGKAYRLKELFDDFWEMKNPSEAEGFLAFWCDLADEAAIAPLRDLQTQCESIGKASLTISRPGYRNTTNFVNMIYFTCGKLKFDYPQYST